MRSRRFGVAAGGLLLLGLASAPGPVRPLVYLVPTDEAMVDRARAIVFGRVRSAAPGPSGRFPTTDVEVEVEATLKGSLPGSRIVVRRPGGMFADGRVARMTGLSRLSEGDRVLLFLEAHAGVWRTAGLGLGTFFEVRRAGRSLLLRDAAVEDQTLLSHSGGDGTPTRRAAGRYRESSRFRNWIADRATGREREADYLVTRGMDDPAGAMREYAFFRTDRWCIHPFAPPRWRRFDRGGIVTFLVSDAVGSETTAARGLRRAVEAWNGVPGSTIRLAVGTRPREDTSRGAGFSSVDFEDPHDVIYGSVDETSVLAGAWTIYRCRRQVDGEWRFSKSHRIPGRPEVLAYEILGAHITTNDGLEDFVRELKQPQLFDEVMAHELGHALGLAHSCAEDFDCDPFTSESVMRAFVGSRHDLSGADLGADDRAAARALYPSVGASADGTPERRGCWSDVQSLCLGAGRYRASARWTTTEWDPTKDHPPRTPNADLGRIARAAPLTDDTGFFWFFDPDNVEVVVKVLDGCAVNGHRWVFAAGLTDVKVELFVLDTLTGRLKTYKRQGGRAFAPALDTTAFSCQEGR